MKIKIIDLLNKIANNEEVPEKIMFDEWLYIYNEREKTYYDEEDRTLWQSYNFKILTDKVEIIEEPKKIEKIDEILRIDDLIPPYGENEYKAWKNIIIQQNKINELIDEINNLKEND